MVNDGELAALVGRWNEHYMSFGKEVKDMSDEEYEDVVIEELLDVVGGSAEVALAVFNHEDNVGGWMVGDVAGRLLNLTRANKEEEE